MNKIQFRAIKRHHNACRQRMIAMITRNNGTRMYVLAKNANPFSVDMYIPWKQGKDLLD